MKNPTLEPRLNSDTLTIVRFVAGKDYEARETREARAAAEASKNPTEPE